MVSIFTGRLPPWSTSALMHSDQVNIVLSNRAKVLLARKLEESKDLVCLTRPYSGLVLRLALPATGPALSFPSLLIN